VPFDVDEILETQSFRIVVPALSCLLPEIAMTTTTAPRTVSDPAETIRHSLWASVALHLAPGIVMLVFYIAAAPLVMQWGYPPLFASLLTIPLILVPWMLGYLSYAARRSFGTWNPLAVVGYRSVLTRWQYAGYTVVLTIIGAGAFVASDALLGTTLVDAISGWLPAWFVNPADMDHIVGMTAGRQVIFLASLLVFAGFVAPVVEEFYFRGHLMAGIARFGVWAPVISVTLFTLYHFESPWEGPARFLMVLPMVYMVWRTRSVMLGVIVHVTLNTLSALMVVAAVVAA
jgi:uncharacterized protein